MPKRLILIVSLLASSFSVLADSWNSDKNIDRAMNAAFNTYKSKGVVGMVDESKNCYAGLDANRTNRNVGRDVEYCISYVFSALIIDNEISKAMNFPRNKNLDFTQESVRAMYFLEASKQVGSQKDFESYLIPRLEKIKQGIDGFLAGNGASKSETREKCVGREILKWDKKRETEIEKWCASLAKKNQECRISAGQEALVKQDALEKIEAQCG